jgi:hypothetical protein
VRRAPAFGLPRVYVDVVALRANDGAMTLARQRRFVTPEPDETLEALAARALPGEPLEAAMEQIRGWNLHIFAMRRPRALMLGSDVVFVEPPLA